MAQLSNETIDPTALARLRRIGGDKLATQMIELFLLHGPERVNAAEAGYAVGDLHRIEAAVHTMKSSAGNLGAVLLQQCAEALELAAQEGRTQDVALLMPALRTAYDAAAAALTVTPPEIS